MPGYWTVEAREAARARISKNQPWKQSTGPRTKQGKAIASKNAMAFANQVRARLWCYFPHHKIFVRTDTAQGGKLAKFYRANNLFYCEPSILINGLNMYGERWLDSLL